MTAETVICPGPDATQAPSRSLTSPIDVHLRELFELGGARHPFTIPSVSKPFAYRLALQDHGIW